MAGNGVNWRGLTHTLNEWTEQGIQDTNPEAYRLLRYHAHTLRGPVDFDGEKGYLEHEQTVNYLYQIILDRWPEKYRSGDGTDRSYLFKRKAVEEYDDLRAMLVHQDEYLQSMIYGSKLNPADDIPGWSNDTAYCQAHSASYWYPPNMYYTAKREDADMRSLLWIVWGLVEASRNGRIAGVDQILRDAAQTAGEQANYYWSDFYADDALVTVGGIEFRCDPELPSIVMRQIERKR